MLPTNPTYRRLIRKYIPQISEEELAYYDSYSAFLYQKKLEMMPVPVMPVREQKVNSVSILPPEDSIDKLIRKLRNLQTYIIAAYTLWIARKNYAIQQKSFLQPPTSFKMIWNYLYAGIYYRFILIQTLPLLWFNKCRYYLARLFKLKMILSNSTKRKVPKKSRHQS